MKENCEIIDAANVKVVYEDSANENNQELELSESMQVAIRIDKKLYKNRHDVSRADENLLPKTSTKKLDDKLYRNSKKSKTSLVKDFEKHKIRSFEFVAMQVVS